MSTWTIVPIRGLVTGKSRLAALLTEEERLSLNADLFERALAAVVAMDGSAARCIVASAGADALDLARRRGAVALEEAPDTGLNPALDAARQSALARGAEALLVVAADLPAINGAALARLRAAVPPGGAAVVADKTDTGTNALLLPARAALDFAFGAGSLARHRDALAGLGIAVQVWRDADLALDIDTPEDYLAWRAGEASTGRRGAA